MCVLMYILLGMCPHATIHVMALKETPLQVSGRIHSSMSILLYTTISYYIYVLIRTRSLFFSPRSRALWQRVCFILIYLMAARVLYTNILNILVYSYISIFVFYNIFLIQYYYFFQKQRSWTQGRRGNGSRGEEEEEAWN
jgi:hypothetical protein